MFGTIKLLGDQLAIPAQDGLRFRDQGDLLQRLTSEPLSDRGQRRSLRIGQSESGWQMRAKDPFSVIRYSFWSKSCWFTIPVTYANSRATCVFFIETHHHIPAMFSMDSDCLTIRRWDKKKEE